VQPVFRERAKRNHVPVARLIGFQAKDIGDGRATSRCRLDASMQIPWERSTTEFSATLLT
jgi:hypothetical protein